MTRSAVLSHSNGFSNVVVVTGHVTDPPGRATPRFPESCVPSVETRVASCFEKWGVGPNSLVICGGARGGDLLAAGTARRRGATVWVLLAHPAERFVETSVIGGADHWVQDFWYLLARAPSWTLDIDAATRATDEVYRRTNEWMLAVADAQSGAHPFDLLAIWDGRGAEGEGGTGDMVVHARRAGAAVEVIDPLV